MSRRMQAFVCEEGILMKFNASGICRPLQRTLLDSLAPPVLLIFKFSVFFFLCRRFVFMDVLLIFQFSREKQTRNITPVYIFNVSVTTLS